MTLTIYDQLEQGTPEWLEARRGIVTASTVGKLLTSTGKVANNETSRALTDTLVAELLTGRVEYTPPTRDMQRGTILEDASRNIYAEHYGEVTEIGFARLDADTYTLGASPDGLVGEVGGFETKSPRARTHLRTILEDRVPPVYVPQVQACLLVTGRRWWDFASYVPGMAYYTKRVYPDPAIHAAIIAAAERYAAFAKQLMHYYASAKSDMPDTPYWDPFEDQEEIE